MVARDAQRVPGIDHAHRKTEDRRGGRTSIDEVADEQGAAPIRVVRATAVDCDLVSQLVKELAELVEAAVDVTDDVERSVVGAAVIP